MRRWLAWDPQIAPRQFVGYTLARLGVAFVWIWHGLVPKLIFDHPDESVMLTDVGIAPERAAQLVRAAGVGEVLFGLVVLAAWRWRVPLWITAAVMVFATIGVTVGSPRFLTAAFNPVTLNFQLFLLAVIALILGRPPSPARVCFQKSPPAEAASRE